jgi:hypothetical protein
LRRKATLRDRDRHLARSRFFHRKIGRSEGENFGGWRCRQRVCSAVASSTPLASSKKDIFGFGLPKTKMRSLSALLIFRSSCEKISEGLDTNCQHGKQPEALARLGPATAR